MEDTYTVDLDIVTDGPLRPQDLRDDLTKDLNLTVAIVQDRGPSGWPVVRFIGPAEDMARLLVRYAEGDLFEVLTDAHGTRKVAVAV